jgi:hypothetical protein
MKLLYNCADSVAMPTWLLGSVFVLMGWDSVSELQPSTGLLSTSRWYMSMDSHGGMILTEENRRTRKRTCPSVALSTINPTWTDQGANMGVSVERQATSRLRHGTVLDQMLLSELLCARIRHCLNELLLSFRDKVPNGSILLTRFLKDRRGP